MVISLSICFCGVVGARWATWRIPGGLIRLLRSREIGYRVRVKRCLVGYDLKFWVGHKGLMANADIGKFTQMGDVQSLHESSNFSLRCCVVLAVLLE
jgi:hypothetical protein